MNEKKQFSAKETADLIGVNVRTLEYWEKNNTLPPDTVTPTRRRYYDADTILSYLQKQEKEAKERLAYATSYINPEPKIPLLRAPKEEKLLSVREFAELIGVSPNTLRNWDKSGKLKPYLVSGGGHRLYKKGQADALRTRRR